MPLEIREIVVQMQVDDDAPAPPATSQRSALDLLACGGEKDSQARANAALVEQCVRAVLAELDRRGTH